MFYIRTEKNKYDIDIIIDVSDNVEFVNATNFQWIEINSEQKPEIGTYYYDGKLISIDSPDYSIIENIIFEYEEPLRIERDGQLRIEEENIANDVFDEVAEEVEFFPISQDIEPPEDSEDIIEKRKQDMLELPPPKVNTYDVVESTQENLEQFIQNLDNIGIAISAYELGNYTFSNNEVVFTPPLEYTDGTIQETTIIPLSITLEEQIQHLKDQREQMIILINRIKKDLQITD